jgi:hypothetical protein
MSAATAWLIFTRSSEDIFVLSAPIQLIVMLIEPPGTLHPAGMEIAPDAGGFQKSFGDYA